MKHSPIAIAKIITTVAPASNLHMQRLVYIAHGYHLAVLKQPLIDDVFEATQWGPMCWSLYDHVKHFGRHPITIEGFDEPISAETVLLVTKVADLYKNYTSGDLFDLCFEKDGPCWKRYCSPLHVIAENDLMIYFSKKLDLI